MLILTTQLLFSAKSHLSPPPIKKKSDGEREYLRLDEINAMMKVARKVGRHGIRDSTIILEMFRHGLRTAELVALRWNYIGKDYYLDNLKLCLNQFIYFVHFVYNNRIKVTNYYWELCNLSLQRKLNKVLVN